MVTKRKRTTPAKPVGALDEAKLQHHAACEYPACTSVATTVDQIVDNGSRDWHNLVSHCTAHTTA